MTRVTSHRSATPAHITGHRSSGVSYICLINCGRSNDMYWNEFMSNDTWYGVTLMFRLRYYWNNVMSNATYNVIVIAIV